MNADFSDLSPHGSYTSEIKKRIDEVHDERFASKNRLFIATRDFCGKRWKLLLWIAIAIFVASNVFTYAMRAVASGPDLVRAGQVAVFNVPDDKRIVFLPERDIPFGFKLNADVLDPEVPFQPFDIKGGMLKFKGQIYRLAVKPERDMRYTVNFVDRQPTDGK